MKYKLLVLCIIISSFIVVLLFWPRTVELPRLGTFEDPGAHTDDGSAFNLSNTEPKLIMFFFTDCPDVCPMTIFDLKKLQQKLGNEDVKEEDYQVIAITLDPEVDTKEKIANFKKDLDITASNWFFLRASVEQTKQLTKAFNMVYQKSTDGFITHSTTMYLVDSNNNIRAYHDMAIGKKSVDLDLLVTNMKELLD